MPGRIEGALRTQAERLGRKGRVVDAMIGTVEFTPQLFQKLSAIVNKRKLDTRTIAYVEPLLSQILVCMRQAHRFQDAERVSDLICLLGLVPKLFLAYESTPEPGELDRVRHAILSGQLDSLLHGLKERADEAIKELRKKEKEQAKSPTPDACADIWEGVDPADCDPLRDPEDVKQGRALPNMLSCENCVQNLAFSKGASALTRSSPVPRNRASRRKFIQLQNRGGPVRYILSNYPIPGALNIAIVRRAIQTASPFTSPGVDGWTADHMKGLVRANRGSAILDIISLVENIMATNLLTDDHCGKWVLKSALGEPIPKGGKNIEIVDRNAPKDDGPVRPLAIGDAFRRIALRARIQQVGNAKLRLATGHDQTGVAVSAGAEIASLRLKLRLRMLKVEEEYKAKAGQPRVDIARRMGIVSCDVANAFQCMSREHIIDAVNTRCPELNGLTEFLYSKPGTIVLSPDPEPPLDEGEDPETRIPDDVVESTCGVHQGCPLGPILFAIALYEPRRRIRELMQRMIRKTCPDLDATYSDYADDNSALVPLELMGYYITITKYIYQQYGMRLAEAKTHIFTQTHLWHSPDKQVLPVDFVEQVSPFDYRWPSQEEEPEESEGHGQPSSKGTRVKTERGKGLPEGKPAGKRLGIKSLGRKPDQQEGQSCSSEDSQSDYQNDGKETAEDINFPLGNFSKEDMEIAKAAIPGGSSRVSSRKRKKQDEQYCYISLKTSSDKLRETRCLPAEAVSNAEGQILQLRREDWDATVDLLRAKWYNPGIIVTGVPIGSPEFTAKRVMDYCDGTLQTARRVAE